MFVPSSLGHKRRLGSRVPICPRVDAIWNRYFWDLLRLRNMLAAPARPAPTMAIQGVSFATAASSTRDQLIVGGRGLFAGRDRCVTIAQISGGTRKIAPAMA